MPRARRLAPALRIANQRRPIHQGPGPTTATQPISKAPRPEPTAVVVASPDLVRFVARPRATSAFDHYRCLLRALGPRTRQLGRR
jgi:hypothetical protein